ncbi:mutT/nudix family protein [Streptococcus pneumoniae]|nr:mutT/nudix family protein [Streptococcus pneumoniae]VJC23318.1 mutT/nudix family protein [Streptococcus pneumoniae]VPJ98597.1 mutT/nudix family protein [Streptococcus pneumoniae]
MNTDYIARYGVYAVIPNPEQKQIVLVQEPNGAWFLPCGKIEAGENHQEALKHELIEELGFTQQKLVPITDKLTNISILVIVIPTTTILPTSMKQLLSKKYKSH